MTEIQDKIGGIDVTAKEFLSRALTLDKEIRSKKEQIDELRSMQTSIGSSLVGGIGTKGHHKDRLGDLSAAVMDLIDDYIMDVTRLLLIKSEIKKAVSLLEDPIQRLLLEERYINIKLWEKIAEDNYMSWDTVHRLHRKAISCIEQLHSEGKVNY